MELPGIVADFELLMVKVAALDVFPGWFGVVYRLFEVGKHPFQKHYSLVGLLADGWSLCSWVDDAFRFLDCFVLGAFLVVQYEVDYINAFPWVLQLVEKQ